MERRGNITCPPGHVLQSGMCTIKPTMTCPSSEYEIRNNMCRIKPVQQRPNTQMNKPQEMEQQRPNTQMNKPQEMEQQRPNTQMNQNKPPPMEQQRPLIETKTKEYSDIQPFKL